MEAAEPEHGGSVPREMVDHLGDLGQVAEAHHVRNLKVLGRDDGKDGLAEEYKRILAQERRVRVCREARVFRLLVQVLRDEQLAVLALAILAVLGINPVLAGLAQASDGDKRRHRLAEDAKLREHLVRNLLQEGHAVLGLDAALLYLHSRDGESHGARQRITAEQLVRVLFWGVELMTRGHAVLLECVPEPAIDID